MVLIKVIGGLGNQMFQFALGRAISLSHGDELRVDEAGFKKYTLRVYELDKFVGAPLKMSRLQKLRVRLTQKNVFKQDIRFYSENGFAFQSEVLKMQGSLYLDGYWQSERYFSGIRDTLIRDFKLKAEPSEKNAELLRQIGEQNSVSLHIRRGDYVSNSEVSKFHGVLPISYYEKAVSDLKNKERDLKYYIFSDDPGWVAENLKIDGDCVYISHNQDAGEEDLRLMQHCKHNIIANSSFSWWAAWLNNNPGKRIYAPARWFADEAINTSDLIPSEWNKISF